MYKNLNELEIQFYKTAKEHEISMAFSSEKQIEVIESNEDKFKEFARSISNINPKTRVIDLIRGGEDSDIRGNSILDSKSKYLLDDDYYKRLIGEVEEDSVLMDGNQVTLF